MSNRYLRLTIHDNDFATVLSLVCDMLYSIFFSEDRYPTDDDLPELKEYVKNLLHNAYQTLDMMRWSRAGFVRPEYFSPHMEFVNEEDIPDWDNAESYYIPMFDGGEILWR